MSNTQTKNVPELRFPGFEGEWEEKKLGDLGLFQKSYSFSRAKEGNGKTKHIHYGDIHSKFKTVLDSDGNIPNIIEKAVFELIQKGDIVFADASEDYSDLGKAVMIDFKPNSLISGLHTHLFRPLNNAISNFLIFYTKTLSYKKFIRQQGTGISVLGISKKSLLNLNVLIPRSELEQQKVGKFFSKLDRQIELEEQKIELLQQQKKGYIQKIFSQELRFKDENGDDYPEWEETTIKEIAQINTGKKDTKDAITNGSYDFYVRSPIVYKINTFSYEGEAILTVGDGVGVGKVFHYVNGKFDYHQRVYKISDFKNFYGLLLFYYFSQNFLKETKKYSAKTSVDSVRKDMVANMKVPRPIYIEQEKIGQFIKKVDNKIKIQKQVIELLKQRKKALLQKMFI
ncbi:restriction endonuclease subunit S [Staphylococcus aureus]|uniref:restriction endonuclease subunit S n=1 Tax=Staphylococcus aureus TaxID=1280 RepID=UPI00085C263B|nr:restriction endonuclease subunit S [Staphylococcus aureus]MDF4033247.1 restriction endonuclease subunit S [Staphylococcus aureus]MDU0230822.1 restriction endonuclease subunit S [Staphylococcus aureus]SCT81104.1 Type I restriction-modification system, specificity subunit S [Staphylococcus aureus]SCU11833.1 Type I restriction-modification system, specificity subunit S [Staphylococcus aureus]HDJ1590753.1 restriction endonuclease subunit S [Staphylococcus aureus]